MPERTLPLSRLEPAIGRERHGRLVMAGNLLKKRLGGRTIWNVNSTAVRFAEVIDALIAG